jgi:hypothetical protein
MLSMGFLTKRVALWSLLTVFSMVLAQASEAEIQAGITYKSLTRVRSSWTGTSIQIPADYQGSLQNATSFLMRHTGGSSVVLAVSQVGATLQDMQAFLNSPQDAGNGVLVRPSSSARVEQNRISQRYQAGQFVSLALSVVGSFGNGTTFFYFGPSNLEANGQKVLESLASSLRFSKPQASEVLSQWNQNLRGKQIYLFDYTSTGNTKTGTDTTREANWELCTNGQYTYSGNVQTSLNVTITDPSDSSNWTDRLGQAGLNASNHTGRWKVVMLGITPTLMLVGNDGFVRGHALWFNGRDVRLDGTSVQVRPSTQCP